MYLYCCIFIGGAVFLTCSAEPPSSSSQSYDRADISLSYKYNVINLYTTSKPLHHSNQNPNNKYQLRSPLNYQNIQYAPLFLKPKEQNSSAVLNKQEEIQKAELNTESNASMFDIENNEDRDSQQRQEQKRNLFPHSVTEPIEGHPRKYVPGYNVNLQALKNKLKQNGLYANNPNFLVKNKQVNVNYLQPQASYKNEKNIQGISQSDEAKTKETYSMLSYKNPQDGKKNNGNILSVNRLNENRPFFYVKAPKLELNLARAQHIARAMHKASVNVNSSFRKLPSLPHEFFSNQQNLQPSNTKLIPIQNSKVFISRRTA